MKPHPLNTLNTNWERHSSKELTLWVDKETHKHVMAEVHDRDCYRVRKLVAGGYYPDAIVDLGAQIGSFACLAAKYWPNAPIFAFEPRVDEFNLLVANRPPNCHLVNLAVVGSTREGYEVNGDDTRWRKKGPALTATDLGNLLSPYCEKDIFGHASIDNGPQRSGNLLLKMDIEGSEIHLLPDIDESGVLDFFSAVHGEWHYLEGRAAVEQVLGTDDWNLEVDRSTDSWNHFWARRKS